MLNSLALPTCRLLHSAVLSLGASLVRIRQWMPASVFYYLGEGGTYVFLAEGENRSDGPRVFSLDALLQAGSYTNYFADALIAEAELDSRVVGIHAAMGGGTGMNRFEQRFPRAHL